MVNSWFYSCKKNIHLTTSAIDMMPAFPHSQYWLMICGMPSLLQSLPSLPSKPHPPLNSFIQWPLRVITLFHFKPYTCRDYIDEYTYEYITRDISLKEFALLGKLKIGNTIKDIFKKVLQSLSFHFLAHSIFHHRCNLPFFLCLETNTSPKINQFCTFTKTPNLFLVPFYYKVTWC